MKHENKPNDINDINDIFDINDFSKDEKKFYTIQEVMEILKMNSLSSSRSKIDKLIRDSQILSEGKDGKAIKIIADSVQEYLQKERGVTEDWFIAACCRTSTLRDPNGRKIEKGWSRLWAWMRKICHEREIPLISKPRSWAGFANLRLYGDCGSVNAVKGYDLRDKLALYRDAAMGFAGVGPKMRYLFLESFDRWTKADIREWTQWAKAMGVEFICRDMEGMSDEEILKLSDANQQKAAVERMAARYRRGQNLSEADRERRFETLIPLVKKAIRTANDKTTKGKLQGMMKVYREGTPSVKLATAMWKFLHSLGIS